MRKDEFTVRTAVKTLNCVLVHNVLTLHVFLVTLHSWIALENLATIKINNSSFVE